MIKNKIIPNNNHFLRAIPKIVQYYQINQQSLCSLKIKKNMFPAGENDFATEGKFLKIPIISF